jgi:uncharacterized membrane protein
MASETKTWLGLPASAKPLAQAGIVLGIGLGGFFDGIVLHQLLQWHHMVSNPVPPTTLGGMELNVVADGLFHAGTYLFTIVGIALLIRAWRRPSVPPSGRVLAGSALIGWGLFNLVEGIVNHHVLELHYVWPDGPGGVTVWNVAFLVSGLVLLGGGYAVARSADASSAASRGERATDERTV